MLIINEKNLDVQITRGDYAPFTITANDEDGGVYTFKQGEVVKFKVFKANDCSCIVLEKSVTVDADTTEVTINFEHEETLIEDSINKPKDYWYEVELNPDTKCQTIIGYRKDYGPRLFTILPSGGK